MISLPDRNSGCFRRRKQKNAPKSDFTVFCSFSAQNATRSSLASVEKRGFFVVYAHPKGTRMKCINRNVSVRQVYPIPAYHYMMLWRHHIRFQYSAVCEDRPNAADIFISRGQQHTVKTQAPAIRKDFVQHSRGITLASL